MIDLTSQPWFCVDCEEAVDEHDQCSCTREAAAEEAASTLADIIAADYAQIVASAAFDAAREAELEGSRDDIPF